MGAREVLSALQEMGLSLSATGESLRAEPKAAITNEARNLIRAHKAELLATLTRSEPATIAEDCGEFFEERAAIMEFDAGLSRQDAESAAREAAEKHRLECWQRFEKAGHAILSLPTRAMQKRELVKYCEGKSAAECADMRAWLALSEPGR